MLFLASCVLPSLAVLALPVYASNHKVGTSSLGLFLASCVLPSLAVLALPECASNHRVGMP